eukprot:TRINITY_DN4438_c0_g3_i1.p1 TRINITY_DN4438_c0_g3~~TRINITY_DN4438_c0_g3_i1.p1  ORF type:complete len:560 (-),score=66.87 TRINITY_DN4438_c0_g3_i1:1030-2709(-)
MAELRVPLLDSEDNTLDVRSSTTSNSSSSSAPGSVEYNFKLDLGDHKVYTISRAEDEKKERKWIPTTYDIKEFWLTKGLAALIFAIWVVINIVLFGEAMYRYRESNTFVMFARGGGQLLNFNCALILIPILRNVLTALRRTFLHNFFPWDANIVFHRRIAALIVIAGTLHGMMHYFNYHVVAVNTPDATDLEWQLAFRTKAGATGHFLVIIMVLMYTSAMYVFRRPHFTSFFLTHHLFIPFYVLLLVHGPNFWKWFIFPGICYFIERFAREYRGKRNVRLLKVISHPSDVLEVHLQKKRRFLYSAGQYLYLNCPYISRYEWHPFTITTAPEQEYVSCHIRCVGPWTKRLREILNPENKPEIEINRTYGPDGQHIIRLDGPFGSASQDVFLFKTVMLIGAGIGVTPFASILRSVIINMRANREITLKNVYFYWICREYVAFEWFRDLLKEIEDEAKQRGFALKINIFFTGNLKQDKLKDVLTNANSNLDPITQLESRTNYGRPRWEAIFEDIRERHSNSEIGVFFCGPKELSSKLRKTCGEFTRHSERHGCTFVFHKENF